MLKGGDDLPYNVVVVVGVVVVIIQVGFKDKSNDRRSINTYKFNSIWIQFNSIQLNIEVVSL